jgi:hypothetical protein
VFLTFFRQYILPTRISRVGVAQFGLEELNVAVEFADRIAVAAASATAATIIGHGVCTGWRVPCSIGRRRLCKKTERTELWGWDEDMDQQQHYSITKQQVVSAKIVSDTVGDRFREPHPALQSDRAPPTAKAPLH